MNAQPCILIVEDERHLAEGIAENLQAEGYETRIAHDGLQGLSLLRTMSVDLVILDVMLPKMDGFSLCKAARSEGIETPILFLTVKGTAEDRIRGLEVGGDDYLVKPFPLRELLLRVAAILKRTRWYADRTRENQRLRFAGNTIDFSTYKGRAWDGTEAVLTHKEAMILKMLSESEGAIVSREAILDRIWGYEVFPSTRTIDNFIVRLRKRFEPDPEAPRHIHTVRGVGYRFTIEPEGRPSS